MQWLKNNTLMVGGIGILVLILGFWLAVIHPKQQANEAYNSAVALLHQETSEAGRLQREVEQFSLWYKPQYLVRSAVLLKQSAEKIAQANIHAKKAESANVDEKYAFATEALALLKNGNASVSALLSVVKQELAGYVKMTVYARAKLQELSGRKDNLSSEFEAVNKSYAVEYDAYLAKYTNLMAEQLLQAHKLLGLLSETLEIKIPVLLPPDDDTTKSGDPDEALALLASVENKWAQSDGLLYEVQSELHFQKEALENVGQAVKDASGWSQKAGAYISVIATNQKLSPQKSLYPAYVKYRDSLDLLKKAEETLRTKVEGKYDNPLAYKSALDSTENAKAAIAEADAQVELLSEALDGIHELQTTLENTGGLLDRSYYDIAMLKQYHKEGAWQEVGGHAKEISSRIREADKTLAKAKAYADLNVERFSDAVDVLRLGVDSVNQAQALFEKLHSVWTALEGARGAWSGVENRAQYKINSERSDVARYGSYSNSAKLDFEKAVALLRAARIAAKDRDYLKAGGLASSAEEYADGTGSKAYQAYQKIEVEKEKARSSENNSNHPIENKADAVAPVNTNQWKFSNKK